MGSLGQGRWLYLRQHKAPAFLDPDIVTYVVILRPGTHRGTPEKELPFRAEPGSTLSVRMGVYSGMPHMKRG